MISERREHRDESVAPICQGKDAELVEDVDPIWDGRKQPIKVVLIDALRKEGDDSKERSGIIVKFLEHRGGE